MFHRCISLILLFIISLLLTCSAFASFREADFFTLKSHQTPHSLIDELNINNTILAQYKHWQGVKYQWGGTTEDGVDCSALMQHIYHDGLSLNLPRTTGEQIHKGVEIAMEDIRPGDLVFFKTKPTVRHVGVYIGDHTFIHASSSQGVTKSRLDKQYWTAHFETARRVIS